MIVQELIGKKLKYKYLPLSKSADFFTSEFKGSGIIGSELVVSSLEYKVKCELSLQDSTPFYVVKEVLVIYRTPVVHGNCLIYNSLFDDITLH